MNIFAFRQILAQELGPATNLSSIVNVFAYINDVNDNSPVFDRDMYIAEIPENITAGRRVIEVWTIPFWSLIWSFIRRSHL